MATPDAEHFDKPVDNVAPIEAGCNDNSLARLEEGPNGNTFGSQELVEHVLSVFDCRVDVVIQLLWKFEGNLRGGAQVAG